MKIVEGVVVVLTLAACVVMAVKTSYLDLPTFLILALLTARYGTFGAQSR